MVGQRCLLFKDGPPVWTLMLRKELWHIFFLIVPGLFFFPLLTWQKKKVLPFLLVSLSNFKSRERQQYALLISLSLRCLCDFRPLSVYAFVQCPANIVCVLLHAGWTECAETHTGVFECRRAQEQFLTEEKKKYDPGLFFVALVRRM